MPTPNPMPLESARRLLALELLTLPNAAAAAAQMYEKIRVELSRLVGAAGVQALFSRSVKLAKLEHPCLAGFTGLSTPELPRLATQLRDCLQAEEPEVAV